MSPNEFDEFLDGHGTRRRITTAPVRSALRAGQSFHLLEQAAALGVPVTPTTYQQEAGYHALHDVNRLSNIDKHRRLPVSVWWPSLLHWGSNRPTQYAWSYDRPWPWDDGDVVGRLTGPPDVPEVHQEFDLVAGDRQPWGTSSSDLPETAGAWLSAVRCAISQVLNKYFP